MRTVRRGRIRLAAGAILWLPASAIAFPGGAPGLPLDTDLADYFLPGTQPDPTGIEVEPFFAGVECILCHGNFEQANPPLPLDAEPYRNWAGSMMGQAARDPVFWAALTIANQDATDSGDLCLRCHSPGGWLAGRSTPTNGLGLLPDTSDFDGVVCHFCHRQVNPTFVPGASPAEDLDILADLELQGFLPTQAGNGEYVVDPTDRRRGPYDLGEFFFYHAWLQSPFHQQATLCGTCHDVSNPLYTRQKDGSYALNVNQDPHPTLDKFEMFPIERTFSEWSNSQFANGGVQMNGRFGGNHPTGIMEVCQDCHMPDQVSPGCRVPGFAPHEDMPAHFLNGANNWVLNAVNTLYSDGDTGLNDPVFIDQNTGLDPDIINDAIARSIDNLQRSSDLETWQGGNRLNVRVLNYCGHKLPSGYAEGRQMWVNVKFLDADQSIVYEHGAYDFVNAHLNGTDTKVYHQKMGIDEPLAKVTGLPAGESQHFVLNNVVLFDNRIPPIGFTNAGFAAVQAEPVGYTYADGQHWDDTAYVIPPGSVQAVVTVYFQVSSKEYIEFLRDENKTDNRGQIAYDQWVLHGKSTPVVMDSAVLALQPLLEGDVNNDGIVNTVDFLALLKAWGPCPAPCPPICAADVDGNCDVGVNDFLELLKHWTIK